MSAAPSNNNEKILKVAESLKKVTPEMNNIIISMSKQIPQSEIIRQFNQLSLDLFDILNDIAIKFDKESDFKIGCYRVILANALKSNIKLPVDKFTLVILEFAPEIYMQNEDCFLSMNIPDKEISAGNAFAMIRSTEFKNMWKILDSLDKENIKKKITTLTMYAHAYLYNIISN